MAFRERVMMERLGIQEADLARREIERNDTSHTRVMQGRYGLAWQNPLLYHLVLNTGFTSVGSCVKLLGQLVEDPVFQETKDSRMAIADKLLEVRVHSVLNYRSRTGTDSFDIEAAVHGGIVTLTGTVFQKWLSTKIEEIARSVGGVTEIENRIVVLRAHS